jgi:hypothetical protein
MLTLALASFLGIADFIGLGDKVKSYHACSHSEFNLATRAPAFGGKEYLALIGKVKTPQPGYVYSFSFVNILASEEVGLLKFSQAVSPNGMTHGRNVPAVSDLTVNQKLEVRRDIRRIRVKVEGLTATPYEFTCELPTEPPV